MGSRAAQLKYWVGLVTIGGLRCTGKGVRRVPNGLYGTWTCWRKLTKGEDGGLFTDHESRFRNYFVEFVLCLHTS